MIESLFGILRPWTATFRQLREQVMNPAFSEAVYQDACDVLERCVAHARALHDGLIFFIADAYFLVKDQIPDIQSAAAADRPGSSNSSRNEPPPIPGSSSSSREPDFETQRDDLRTMMLNMMQIHFLAHGFTDIHETSAWSQGVFNLAEPTGVFYRILQNAGSLDAWKTCMYSILHDAPWQWEEDEVWTIEVKGLVSAMWKLFKSVWSGHDDVRFLDVICVTATARALEAGCSFTLERKMDQDTGRYTKDIKFKIKGSDVRERFRPTVAQAQRNAERNEREYMLTPAQE